GRLTLAVENTPVQEVLKSIEEQTGYRFFYNNDEIDITLRVNISLDQVPLKKGLAQLFKKLPYSFSVLDNKVILVHPKKEASPAEALRDQNVKEITGSVFDITGNPLPGVTVMVEGSPTGTITDNN